MKTLLAVLLSLILTFSVIAQAEPPGCTMTDINAVIISMQADISTLQIAALDDNRESALAALALLDERVHSLQTACGEQPPAETSTDAGLTFSGSGSRVTDPFEIPPGTYRVTGAFVSEDEVSFASVSLTRLSGTCGHRSIEDNPFFWSEGEPEETLFQSAGCEALLEIGGDMREWTVKFDLIR